jgi:hypothetical protein
MVQLNRWSPIIIVKSRFYFGIRNCRHEVTNRTLANNIIVKTVTLPKVYHLDSLKKKENDIDIACKSSLYQHIHEV